MSYFVIGGGKMGMSHLAILNRLVPSGQIVLCDPSFLTRGFFSKLGIACYSTIDKALANEKKCSAAIIASPTSTHHSLAKLLLSRGIPCFVEKPLTLKPEASEELLDIQRRTGAIAQMGLVLRFVQSFVRLKEIVGREALGRPISYTAHMLGNVVTRADQKSWRTDSIRGGGCLNEYGPHILDLARYIFGDVEDLGRVQFGRKYSVRGDDSVDIAWTHRSGAEGNLRLDWCDSRQRKSHTAFDVKFEFGTVRVNANEIHIDVHDDSTLTEEHKTSLVGSVRPYPVSFYLRGEEFTLQLESFLEKVTGQRCLRADLSSTLAASLEDGVALDRLIARLAAKGALQ